MGPYIQYTNKGPLLSPTPYPTAQLNFNCSRVFESLYIYNVMAAAGRAWLSTAAAAAAACYIMIVFKIHRDDICNWESSQFVVT